jgi:peptidoglycan/xylan/chitin deacetylase (PgdA/CDA1 family)
MKNRCKKMIAVLISLSGILAMSRWLRVHCFNKPSVTILCFHRIVPEGGLISPQCISSDLFEKQMRFFNSKFNFITLDDVASYLSGDVTFQRDVMAFTFDDGYEDNYINAAPILERFKARAAFYIASEPILDGKKYWIDELSILLEALHGSAAIVDLAELDSVALKISQFISAHESQKKQQAKSIFFAVNAINEVQKNKLLIELRKACEVTNCTPSKAPKLMSISQLTALMSRGHIIGAHTHTHPRLSNLTAAQVESEITQGVERLSEHFGEVQHFAYPFGKMADIPTDKTALFSVLHRCGFKMSVTTEDNVLAQSDHKFLVPRKVMSAQSVSQIGLKMELMAWQR